MYGDHVHDIVTRPSKLENIIQCLSFLIDLFLVIKNKQWEIEEKILLFSLKPKSISLLRYQSMNDDPDTPL